MGIVILFVGARASKLSGMWSVGKGEPEKLPLFLFSVQTAAIFVNSGRNPPISSVFGAL